MRNTKNNLSEISTQVLIDEIHRRKAADHLLFCKSAVSKYKKRNPKIKFGCEYSRWDDFGIYKYDFTLGIVKNGKFLDFYYNSGLGYENFQKFIPPGFAECSESTYELSRRTENKEAAIDLLKECGYSWFEEIEE